MPSSTYSWSTKEETMETPSKFRTPPMVRSFDGNNNNGINFGSGLRGKGAKLATPRLNPINGPTGEKLPCDDCGLQKVGLILRWCEDCGAAICDACILDRHPEHVISWYQEAQRLANRKFDEVLENAECKMKQLRTDRIKSQRFQHEIQTKIREIKTKVQRHQKESEELSDAMNRALKEMVQLADVTLNAKTICERHHAANASISMAKALLDRQSVVIKQMKSIDRVISDVTNTFLGHAMNGVGGSDGERITK